MQQAYDTLVQALEGLRKRGYTMDFSLQEYCLKCATSDIQLHPEDFTVEEVYRFEGASNPDDNSVLYAIVDKEGNRGVLVDAYGMYAENVTPEMAKKLQQRES